MSKTVLFGLVVALLMSQLVYSSVEFFNTDSNEVCNITIKSLNLSHSLALKLLKTNSNITVGDIPEKERKNTTFLNIMKDLLKIDEQSIQFYKLEKSFDFHQLQASATPDAVNESNRKELLTIEMNPFLNAIHLAYGYHLPLTISPDVIWHLIVSATSIHINKYSEQLRNRFVDHEGKKKLVVRRDDFIYNSSANPWHEMIDEFVVKIDNFTKLEAIDLFVSNFSTTSDVSKTCSKIVIMDSFQKYFEYEFVTLCGIPEFRILGKKSDWQIIKAKANKLAQIIPEFGIWVNSLNEILQQFIDIYDDKVDSKFWNEIYKIQGGSGGPYLSGWAIALFPYLKENTKNYYVWEKSWKDAYHNHEFGGLTTNNFPIFLNQMPFKWLYLGREIEMTIISGLMAVEYDKVDKNLTPLFAYSICENNKNETTNSLNVNRILI